MSNDAIKVIAFPLRKVFPSVVLGRDGLHKSIHMATGTHRGVHPLLLYGDMKLALLCRTKLLGRKINLGTR